MGHDLPAATGKTDTRQKRTTKKSKNTQSQSAQRMQFRLQTNICESRTSENAPLD
jgi:hypothetical protein